MTLAFAPTDTQVGPFGKNILSKQLLKATTDCYVVAANYQVCLRVPRISSFNSVCENADGGIRSLLAIFYHNYLTVLC